MLDATGIFEHVGYDGGVALLKHADKVDAYGAVGLVAIQIESTYVRADYLKQAVLLVDELGGLVGGTEVDAISARTDIRERIRQVFLVAYNRVRVLRTTNVLSTQIPHIVEAVQVVARECTGHLDRYLKVLYVSHLVVAVFNAFYLGLINIAHVVVALIVDTRRESQQTKHV